MTQHVIQISERRCANSIFVFIYSLLLYLPATALLPATTYYFISLMVLVYRVFYRGFNREFYFIAVCFTISLCISLLSLFFVNQDLHYYNNFIPLQLSILCSLIIATSITRKIAFFLILFMFIECLAGYLQFILGVKTFFPFVSVAVPELGSAQGLLYYMRVYGFNANSSGFAGNVIIMITLFSMFFSDYSRKIRNAIMIFSFLALVVSFSRSGLVAFLLLVMVLFVRDFRINHLKVLLPAAIICVIASFYIVDWSSIFTQLTRGRQSVELSGRDLIWSYYFEQISHNPIFGNHSLRNFLVIPEYGPMHAHNSYIMLMYVLGVLPLFFVALPLIVQFFRKAKSSLLLIALLTYSLAQYFLFWGASLADIVFFTALLSNPARARDS